MVLQFMNDHMVVCYYVIGSVSESTDVILRAFTFSGRVTRLV